MTRYGTVDHMKKRRAESREGMVTFTVALAPELHLKLAIAAVEDRAAIVVIVREAVTDWLEHRERKKGSARRSK